MHAAVGLDKAHFTFTGAAPIATSTLEYFGSLGLVVNEVFGAGRRPRFLDALGRIATNSTQSLTR